MYCPNCGKEIPEGGTSCSLCSNASPALPEAKRRDVYIIFAFFLGWLGIHNFYADRTLIAVIQMLLTVLTCGLLGPAVFLWALIEMFAVTRDGKGVALGGDITRVAGILFAVGLTIVVLILINAAVSIAAKQELDRAHSMGCASNMRQIGLALSQYAWDNNGCYPPRDGFDGLNLLIQRNELHPGSPTFTCPAGDTVNNGRGFLNASNCDYIYLGGATNRNPYYPILLEAPGNHRGNFVNILYSSGNIAGKKQPSSVTDIRKLLKELEKKSSPECIEFLRKKQKLF